MGGEDLLDASRAHRDRGLGCVGYRFAERTSYFVHFQARRKMMCFYVLENNTETRFLLFFLGAPNYVWCWLELLAFSPGFSSFFF